MTVPPSRALALAIEPFAGQVYFSPECHHGYAALGFGPSPGKAGEVQMPDGCAPIVAALGDDLDELLRIVGGWSGQIQSAGGYPAGPQDLAALVNTGPE